MTPEKHHWGKPIKKEKASEEKVAAEKPFVAAPTSSWTPPWETNDQLNFHLFKNRDNEDFLRKVAKHFGVEYSSNFDGFIESVWAQHHL